mgnify:CR=1 FL=1
MTDTLIGTHLLRLRDAILNLHYLEFEPAVRPKDRKPSAIRKMLREEGRDWPAWAATMTGSLRLDNLRSSIETVEEEDIPGDVVETGVWRGGAMIYACAVLDALGLPAEDRKVWLCDSFEGLPPPDTDKWPQDTGSTRHLRENFKVSLEEVLANFNRFRVPLERAEFLKGWFEDTIPGPLADRDIAILRLDGDMYGSTMHVLRSLYDRVTPGGFIIIDDWTASKETKLAVQDFWKERGVQPDVTKVDWTCVFWRKQ